MNTNILLMKEDKSERPLSMHPKEFALYLFLGTVVMLFAALTSAYIVRRADGGWLEFPLPNIFWINSGIILASSFTMQWAFYSAKKDSLEKVKISLLFTTLLAVCFFIGQFYAWQELVAMKVFFGGTGANPAGSFVYVLTGLHAFHLVSGVIFMIVVFFASFQYKVHSKNMLKIRMCTIYWHFLGFLWIYLFVFLLLNR